MISEIFYTLFSIGAFIGAFYLLLLSLMMDWDKRKLDKTCPHCKENTTNNWKSYLMPVKQ